MRRARPAAATLLQLVPNRTADRLSGLHARYIICSEYCNNARMDVIYNDSESRGWNYSGGEVIALPGRDDELKFGLCNFAKFTRVQLAMDY